MHLFDEWIKENTFYADTCLMEQMTGTFVVHVVYKQIENINKPFYVWRIKTFSCDAGEFGIWGRWM